MSLRDYDETMSEDLLSGLAERTAHLAARIAAVCPSPLPVGDVHAVVAAVAENGQILTLVEWLTIELSHARQAQADLTNALASNREIGAAIGILMAHRRVTQHEAFDLLRVSSQARHVKLRELAKEVLETGSLDLRAISANGVKRHRSATPNHHTKSPAAAEQPDESLRSP